MAEKKRKAVDKESLHNRAERHAMYVIIDAVFGLSLGLGAFSLTELPITSTQDLCVGRILLIFVLHNFYIFDEHTAALRRKLRCLWICKHDPILHRLFIAIMPIPIRLILMQSIALSSTEVFEAAFTLYSFLFMCYNDYYGNIQLRFLKAKLENHSMEGFVHQLYEGLGSFVMGFVFLISAFMPYGKARKMC